MKRYKTKDSVINKNEGIPSISNNNIKFNTKPNIKTNHNTNTSNKIILQKLPKIKIKNHNLSTDNLTLKAINNLSLYFTNIPSINDIKKTIEDYYKKNDLNNKSIPIPYEP